MCTKRSKESLEREIERFENMSYDQICDTFGSGRTGGEGDFCMEMYHRHLVQLRKELKAAK